MNSINNAESANQVGYDNTTSGLTATDVQGAVDELVEDIAGKKLTTLSGDTLAELGTAWNNLTYQQKNTQHIKMKVNGHYMTQHSINAFIRSELSTTNSKIIQEFVSLTSSPLAGVSEYTLGQSSAVSSTLTVTSWEFTYSEL